MGRKKMSDETTHFDDATQTTIDGSVHVGETEIQAVTTESDRDILGWIVPFTIGNDFVVPRDWLEARARDLNLSPNLLPSETSQKRAFTRAGGRIDGREVLRAVELYLGHLAAEPPLDRREVPVLSGLVGVFVLYVVLGPTHHGSAKGAE